MNKKKNNIVVIQKIQSIKNQIFMIQRMIIILKMLNKTIYRINSKMKKNKEKI